MLTQILIPLPSFVCKAVKWDTQSAYHPVDMHPPNDGRSQALHSAQMYMTTPAYMTPPAPHGAATFQQRLYL